jgi:hypothetical protein
MTPRQSEPREMGCGNGVQELAAGKRREAAGGI